MGRNAVRDESQAPSKEADLYSWAPGKAKLLRAGRLSEIDPAAIAEEINGSAVWNSTHKLIAGASLLTEAGADVIDAPIPRWRA